MIISIDVAKTFYKMYHPLILNTQENVNIRIREGNIQLASYLLTKD